VVLRFCGTVKLGREGEWPPDGDKDGGRREKGRGQRRGRGPERGLEHRREAWRTGGRGRGPALEGGPEARGGGDGARGAEAFGVQGSLSVWRSERQQDGARRRVARRPSLAITLKGSICAAYNHGFLSRLEKQVRPALAPMMVSAEKTLLDQTLQHALATWAVKTTFLMELAFRQHYPAIRAS
jgi:hypothetical protein